MLCGSADPALPWREMSAPGTDSASAKLLSACSVASLEKKNDVFTAVDHFLKIHPWLLSHPTAFESCPEAYSRILLYRWASVNPGKCTATVNFAFNR